MDEVDGKIAEQPPVPCLAGQPAGPGQVAAGGEDRDSAFPQGLLVRHGHGPRHRIRPQVVRAVPAVVQHPDQRNLPGQVIEGDGPAGDLGDLAGGARAERGQRGQRLTLRVADPGKHLLAGILPRRSGPGREGQPDHGGPAMKRLRDPRVPSEPAGQRPHLDVGEGEVLAADPDHLAGGLTPREGNVRCLAPGQNQVGRGRQRARDLAQERRPRRPRRDLVHVVKQQAHLQRGLPDQGADDFPRSRSGSQARPAGTSAGGHGVEKRRGEADGIFVGRLTAHPHVNPARRDLVRPYRLGQNGCLAEPRPGDEQRHGPVPAALEQLDEPQARYLDVQGTRQAGRTGQQRQGGRRLSGGQTAGRPGLVNRSWSVHRVHICRRGAPHVQIQAFPTAFAPGGSLVRLTSGQRPVSSLRAGPGAESAESQVNDRAWRSEKGRGIQG